MTSRDLRRRLLTYYKPYRWWFVLVFLLIAIHSAIPALLVLLVQKLLDQALIQRDAQMLKLLPVGLVVLYTLNGALSFGRGMLTEHISWQVITLVRQQLFQHMLSLSLGWRQQQPLGELTSKLSQHVEHLRFVVSALVTIVQKPLTLIALLASAFYLQPLLAAIAVFLLPLIAWPLNRFGRRLREASRSELTEHEHLQQSATESLLQFPVIKSYRGEAARLRHFGKHNEQLRQAKLRAVAARLLPGPIIEFIAAVSIGIVIAYGSQLSLAGNLQPGELVAFLLALGLLNAPLKSLSNIQSLWQRALSGAEAVFAILDQAPPDDGDLIVQPPINIELIDAVFDYGEETVLDGVCLTIAAGEVLALSGPSGCGKSTIAALLLGFQKLRAGQLLLNGQPIERYQRQSLYRHIAVVFQDNSLFHSSIMDNLTLGHDFSQEQVISACKSANIHRFIQSLPNGYQSQVQAGGQRLSGGQRQRLCIARALLFDAPLIILDEPSSQLDKTNESQLIDLLQPILQHRTVLLISHRPEIVQLASREFFLSR